MFSNLRVGKTFAALALLAGAQMAHAADGSGIIDGASIEAGAGAKVQFIRGGLQSDWSQRWFSNNGYHLSGHQNLTVVNLTPVFRYERDDKLGFYGEGGIGVSLFSHLYDNNDKRLATAFQFGDHIGAGYVFDNKWEAGFKLQHYSNGGIKHPNGGVNWFVLKVARHF
jgi:lipid A 3-O-deacylase